MPYQKRMFHIILALSVTHSVTIHKNSNSIFCFILVNRPVSFWIYIYSGKSSLVLFSLKSSVNYSQNHHFEKSKFLLCPNVKRFTTCSEKYEWRSLQKKLKSRIEIKDTRLLSFYPCYYISWWFISRLWPWTKQKVF